MARLASRIVTGLLAGAAGASFLAGLLLGMQALQPTAAVPIEEIELGGYGGVTPNSPFAEGGCLAFRERGTWEAFWSLHSTFIPRQRAPPDVDFRRDMILVCYLEWQSNSGDSITITSATVRGDGGYWVFVERQISYRGLATPINPYRIVQVPSVDGPCFFLDRETGKLLPARTLDAYIRFPS